MVACPRGCRRRAGRGRQFHTSASSISSSPAGADGSAGAAGSADGDGTAGVDGSARAEGCSIPLSPAAGLGSSCSPVGADGASGTGSSIRRSCSIPSRVSSQVTLIRFSAGSGPDSAGLSFSSFITTSLAASFPPGKAMPLLPPSFRQRQGKDKFGYAILTGYRNGLLQAVENGLDDVQA